MRLLNCLSALALAVVTSAVPLAAMADYVCARRVMMGANHGAVDHLQRIRHNPAFVEPLWDLLPQPRQGPASELAVYGGPFAELFRQVSPGRARSCDSENPIQNKPMVQLLVSVRSPDSQDEALKERLLVI